MRGEGRDLLLFLCAMSQYQRQYPLQLLTTKKIIDVQCLFICFEHDQNSVSPDFQKQAIYLLFTISTNEV